MRASMHSSTDDPDAMAESQGVGATYTSELEKRPGV